MNDRWRWLAGGVGACAAVLAWAAPGGRFEATVAKVVDGDSLWLRPAGADKAVEVRIRDIDAPEICQPWGVQAREALAERIGGKTLVVQPRGRDAHGRLLALVAVDEANVGAWMVSEGHAWSIRTKWDRGPLVKQERVASALHRGLWSGPNPMPPREFRRTHGPCDAARATAAPTAAASAGPPPR